MWPVIRRPVALRTASAPHQRYSPVAATAGAIAPASATATATFPALEDPKQRGLLYAGEPENCRRDIRYFLPVLAHLGLLLAVLNVYRVDRLQNRAIQTLLLIALAALPVHYLLPYRWKKPMFVAVSIAGLAWIFGMATSAVVLALSAVLIGVCYLPLAWPARAAIVAALTALFAAFRAELLADPAPEGVWPVLGTMFMFRMIIYLYELKHAKKPETVVDTLSYFFLLPNFCFPLFPVVDYRTFHRGYFAAEIHATQRAGLIMMFRGTVHLLLYRLINHDLVISADEVHGFETLARFVVSNYLLYLHVSGQFHIACGMLHLFGFQLPETHRDYLLASSFTDYWRRINIYWKDFMVRVVFNPVVFRLKRWPRPAALAIATATVFVVTWFLHGYQKFWIQGSWGFTLHDGLFWGILGLLVLVNVQCDAVRKPSRQEPRGARALALRTASTAATFATIALLWSLWTSQDLSTWLAMLGRGVGRE